MLMDTTFCMESGQVKTGDDADDTFVKMLQEVSRITVPMAYGIATKCPNIVSLAEGLNDHGPLALEHVRVRPQTLEPNAWLIRSLYRKRQTKMGRSRTGELDRLPARDYTIFSWHPIPLLPTSK